MLFRIFFLFSIHIYSGNKFAKFYLWHKIFSSRVWGRSESRFLEAPFENRVVKDDTVLTSQSREIRLSRQDKGPPRPLSRTVATSLPVTATWKRFPRHVLRAAPPFVAWNVGNESGGETCFSSMILTDIDPMKILILSSQFSVLFYISTIFITIYP